MSTSEDDDVLGAPPPAIKQRAGPSPVWLVPLITALVGGWLVFKTLSEQGPEVTIAFKTAEGIEAGKTRVKYKNVDVGLVEAVSFSEDFKRIIVTARMSKEAESFLRRDTRFWVVRPRLSLRGVSGLSTLISGAYIEIEPGRGAPQREFTGLEVQPEVQADEAGTEVTLMTRKLGSVDAGSPIYYQGILAGEVLGYELGNDQKSVFVHAFIKAPYDDLVNGNTRFWNVSGIDVSVGADGVQVRTESVQSLLFGGIAFETPDTLEPVQTDLAGLVFTLHDRYEDIEEQAFVKKVNFVIFFDSSVRGLNVGAPVEFKGIKVGSVVDVRLEFDPRDTTFRIPVLIEIEPERVIARGADDGATPHETVKTLVDRGLRARLQTGNLLTGQLFVELDMHPDTPVNLVNAGGPFPELPTIPAPLEQLTGLLEKLDKVEFDRIGDELLGTLEGWNRFINAPELHAAVADLESTMKDFRSVLRKVDRRVEPLAENVTEAAGAGRDALVKIQTTLGLLDEVLVSDSPLQSRFIQAAEELAEMARSIRNLVDLLERNPDSIIFGKKPGGG